MNILLNSKLERRLLFILKKIRRSIRPTARHKVFKKNGPGRRLIEAIFIINLDRQPNRWTQFIKEAKRQKTAGKQTLFEFCFRLPAVDGKDLKLSNIPTEKINIIYNLKNQYYVDPDPLLLAAIRHKDILVEMSPEEIAVALSHVAVWQRITREERSYALILEDDIFFESTFANDLNILWAELPMDDYGSAQFDFLYLSYREVDRGAEKVVHSRNLIRPIRGFWWLSGYVLSYAGARKLLSLLPITGPVDLWINLQFQHLDAYAATKSVIYQRVDLGSSNQYSILPILSQIGVQSDKTHLDLQHRKGKNPVFILTQNTIQNAVLDTALSLLGYRCCMDKWNHFSDAIRNFIKAGEPLLFDAYIGVKCIAETYTTLDLMYPNAVFILIESGYKSLAQIASGQDNVDIANVEILKYFENKKHKLLEIYFEELTNWKVLTNFLQCELPKCAFPRINLMTNPEYDTSISLCISIKYQQATVLQHDVHPWVIPFERVSAFGVSHLTHHVGIQAGQFIKILQDEFKSLEEHEWVLLENSFPSNLSDFAGANFRLLKTGGFALTLKKQRTKTHNYTSASLMSTNSFLFGKFEIVMKPVKLDGIITAFFLHRNDPWQELDFESLGKDTSKILLNVYFNPGVEGTAYNYGNRGTPVLIDLDFDASDDYHKYAIEWEPHEIRWLVDDNLIYVRKFWSPTPIPNLPMKLYVNFWPSRSEELVGTFQDETLPVSVHIKSITIHSWSHSSTL